jgi:hypothetical protein
MKKILIILILYTLSGCTGGEPGWQGYEVTRVVQNNSGYNVHIKSYYKEYFDSKVEEYSIDNGKEYKEKGLFDSAEKGSDEIECVGTVDSVIVTFDTMRFQKHCTEFVEGCVEFERRIILDDLRGLTSAGYTRNKSDYVFVYTITKEDYDNAEDIGG